MIVLVNNKLMTELWTNVASVFAGNDEEMHTREEDDDSTSMLHKITSTVKNTVPVNYKNFFITMTVGVLLILASLFYLPFIVLYPQSFLTFFSIGSLIVLISFVFIYGSREYFKMLLNSDRILFTVLYLLSIIVGLYFAYFKNYFIVSLISAVIQFITLTVFVLTFIPGGKTGIQYIVEILKLPVYNLLNRFK